MKICRARAFRSLPSNCYYMYDKAERSQCLSILLSSWGSRVLGKNYTTETAQSQSYPTHFYCLEILVDLQIDANM